MWESSGIRIKQNRLFCINSLQSQVSCGHCTDICPSKAIRRGENGEICLEESACSGCGACLSRCPTQVYTAKEWDEPALIRRVTQSPCAVVELFCGGDEKPYGTVKQEEPHDFVRMNLCFAALSKAAWFEMGQKKKLILHQESCGSCAIRSGQELWLTAVEQAREYLAACSLTPQIELCQVRRGANFWNRRRAETGGEKATSRREFLLTAGNKGMELLLPSILRQADKQIRQPEETRDSLWPSWSRRFGALYSQAEAENGPGEAAVWPCIAVEDSCISCGICSYFCPTGALKKTEKDGICQTLFYPGRCADCRLCEALCSHRAIRRGRRPMHQPFRPRIVQELQITVCRRCGLPCARNSDGICSWCQNKSRLRPMLAQVKKAMKKPGGS